MFSNGPYCLILRNKITPFSGQQFRSHSQQLGPIAVINGRNNVTPFKLLTNAFPHTLVDITAGLKKNNHVTLPWEQGFWGQHGAHLGPTGPRWAPCWPREPCYLGGSLKHKPCLSYPISVIFPLVDICVGICSHHRKHVLIRYGTVPIVIKLCWTRQFVELILVDEGQKYQLITPKQEKLSTIISNILVTQPPGAPYTSMS